MAESKFIPCQKTAVTAETGGLAAGTVLTLGFVPVMYSLCFLPLRKKEETTA